MIALRDKVRPGRNTRPVDWRVNRQESGEDWSWAVRVRDAGITTATQVFDVAGAQRAAEAGVEVLV